MIAGIYFPKNLNNKAILFPNYYSEKSNNGYICKCYLWGEAQYEMKS